jgi:hypothetical protein
MSGAEERVLDVATGPGHVAAAAAELARVLESGGRLALSVWDAPERARFIGLVRDAVARAGGAPSAGPPAGPDAFRFADDAQLRALLEGELPAVAKLGSGRRR